MKILIAEQFSELGGAQQVLLELLPALQDLGWTCVLAAPAHGPLTARAEMLGIRCVEIECGPFGCGAKSIGDLLRFGAQFPRLRAQFRSLADEIRPDVIYINGPRLVPAVCSIGGSAAILFHLHNYLGQRYVAAMTRYYLDRARASIVANCRFVLEPLRMPGGDSRVEVIYNGVRDFTFRERMPASRRIGMIGRICPEKGQKIFVQAARMVHADSPQTSFVICGGTQFSDASHEAYFQEVRELAAGLPVEFIGWRDDPRDVLAGLDLLVVASLPYAEATTRVIPEAYSAGVPVLASDIPGIREIVQDTQTGFLFPPGDPHALSVRMRELIDAPAALSSVAARARCEFEQRFRIEVFQQRMISMLEKVARGALANVHAKGQH
jgi:glycosyltransferase involved in cell wall biosynthesis